MEKLLTVIIPIYNAEKYLRNCIDSICNQTYPSLEIILVDDGSLDSSYQICDEYANNDKRIKVIHQKNQGVSAARNAGLKIASGKWIMFVDSDDYIDTKMCEKLIHKSQSGNFDLILCGFTKKIISGDNITSQETYFPRTNDIVDYKDFCEQWGYLHEKSFFMSPCLKFYRNSIIRMHRIKFNESISLGEDRIFNIEYISKFKSPKIGIVNEALYFYMYNVESGLSKCYAYDERRAENDRFLFSQEIKFARQLGNKACSHVSRSYLYYSIVDLTLIFKKEYRKIYSQRQREEYVRGILLCRETREAIKFPALGIKHLICKIIFKTKNIFLLEFFALIWFITKKL